MWGEFTLSPKGQITLPKDLRDALGLRPGDQLVFSVIDGEVVMTPKSINFNDLAGLLGAPPNGRASLEEIDVAVTDAAGSDVVDEARRSKSDIAA
ncbi:MULTISPECIES: AbrB/MazE/SpoVT family DNA-binding domain-containing protein [unclassified Rhizobium]|uniref:AbrB/MazE/SpoVT family DNA-binding domain-containing protein n=2 Tax=Rhizobium TaxID=379 RepID=UPI001A992DEA|nr:MULTISPECIES: AbrB/MazE/SpoVT family DNA-binding domain-containing protein [unclassified Rhizobium]MBX5158526.1 AbrB/MazE/SpoVT family DNA-binding domain-containing protein [Rhizobium sp. NZLR8]MBX5164070.1 AbrB/MazE/SpoVT family DNA-binding domain-containing protein [Rhizobium sp. NZLR4b]MBX5183530.1 AbrB/MazE/SpoVT family DNA-binding domain-containing protein [Rhizobium sp. NZLR5]MBX5192184.1 AbrB/MazE/SpoVT family DNA-binding domain-containing protein [Rhizobium sp. NZLR3b]MBX5198709.1 A